jgi:hypothetical protein
MATHHSWWILVPSTDNLKGWSLVEQKEPPCSVPAQAGTPRLSHNYKPKWTIFVLRIERSDLSEHTNNIVQITLLLRLPEQEASQGGK